MIQKKTVLHGELPWVALPHSPFLRLDNQWMSWCGQGRVYGHSLSLSPVFAHHSSCLVLLVFPEASVTFLTLAPVPWWRVLSIKQNKGFFWRVSGSWFLQHHLSLPDSEASGGHWYVTDISKFTALPVKEVAVESCRTPCCFKKDNNKNSLQWLLVGFSGNTVTVCSRQGTDILSDNKAPIFERKESEALRYHKHPVWWTEYHKEILLLATDWGFRQREFGILFLFIQGLRRNARARSGPSSINSRAPWLWALGILYPPALKLLRGSEKSDPAPNSVWGSRCTKIQGISSKWFQALNFQDPTKIKSRLLDQDVLGTWSISQDFRVPRFAANELAIVMLRMITMTL